MVLYNIKYYPYFTILYLVVFTRIPLIVNYIIKFPDSKCAINIENTMLIDNVMHMFNGICIHVYLCEIKCAKYISNEMLKRLPIHNVYLI